MSQEVRQSELQEKTRQLLQGPLKHIRAAALAAALLPLASVAAAPAAAQNLCPSGGVCGFVWNDTNNNGIQDAGETGIEGAKVFVCQVCDGTDTISIAPGAHSSHSVVVPGSAETIAVPTPPRTPASPSTVGDDT